MILVAGDEAQGRADHYLCDHVEGLTRSQFKNRLVSLSINGAPAKPAAKIHPGDSIEVELAPIAPPDDLVPEDLKLDILYEDENAVVVDKPQGLVVHPAAGNPTGTLVNGLLFHVRDLGATFNGEELRPGIVHRLDKDTSGVIIAAKHPQALEALSLEFRKKRVKKTYIAVVKGYVTPVEGTVDGNLARDRQNRKKYRVVKGEGKTAVTNYSVIRHLGDYSLLRLEPVTGRTHQLRVHMAHLGHPILGDPLYSRKGGAIRDVSLMLHAYRLTITMPDGEERTFRSPLPERLKDVLRRLGHSDEVPD